MTLDDIASSLPNGFHDAELKMVTLNYEKQQACIILDIWLGDLDATTTAAREYYRQAEITLSGLMYWASELPATTYPFQKTVSLRIDIGGIQDLTNAPPIMLPAIPPDAFVNWIFVQNWNAFIYLAAHNANLVWAANG